jgi:hypothetical protein
LRRRKSIKTGSIDTRKPLHLREVYTGIGYEESAMKQIGETKLNLLKK